MGFGFWWKHLAGLLPDLVGQSSVKTKVPKMSFCDQHRPVMGCSWEELWAPYDERSYLAVLSLLTPQDIVLEIGGGDLRLAKRMAAIAGRVYAIEIQKMVLEKAGPAATLPKNLEVIHGDACTIPFPTGITITVLLMRHCTQFDLYIQKIMAAGCNKLITNARWGSGVEIIDLQTPRLPFDKLEIGWYACLCGAAGFKPGPLELLKDETILSTAEVHNCPNCCAASHTAANPGQMIQREDRTLEPIPIFTNLPTEIKTLYREGA
jgi:hypothetical protein